jgi:hypothetical protein
MGRDGSSCARPSRIPLHHTRRVIRTADRPRCQEALRWGKALKAFLDIDPKDIGIIGDGRRKPTGSTVAT